MPIIRIIDPGNPIQISNQNDDLLWGPTRDINGRVQPPPVNPAAPTIYEMDQSGEPSKINDSDIVDPRKFLRKEARKRAFDKTMDDIGYGVTHPGQMVNRGMDWMNKKFYQGADWLNKNPKFQKAANKATNIYTNMMTVAPIVNYIDNLQKQRRWDKWFSLSNLSDNLYAARPASMTGNRGDWDINTGIFRPNEIGFKSKGMYTNRFDYSAPGIGVSAYGGSINNNTNPMQKVRIRITDGPEKMATGGQPMTYSGQLGYGINLGQKRIYTDMPPDKTETINKTVQPVPKDQANIEAEKGETVFGDLDGDGALEHMLIGGKKHTEGGTPLNVPEGSFIFSDTKDLTIKDKKVLEKFNMPASRKGYTPAEIAKKYDTTKYKAIIEDENADPIKKATAQIMVKTFEKKLAELALIQEQMKGFPQGIPEVAKKYFPNLQTKEDQQRQPGASENIQYGQPQEVQGQQEEMVEGMQQEMPMEEQMEPQMEYGGMIPRYNFAGEVSMYDDGGPILDVSKAIVREHPYNAAVSMEFPNGDIYVKYSNGVVKKIGSDKTETIIKNSSDNPFLSNYGKTNQSVNANSSTLKDGIDTGENQISPWRGDKYENRKNASKYSKEEWADKLRKLGYTGPLNNEAVQRWLYSQPKSREVIEQLHKQYGDPKKGMFDKILGYRWDSALDVLEETPSGDDTIVGYKCTGRDASGKANIISSSYMNKAAMQADGAVSDKNAAYAQCPEKFTPGTMTEGKTANVPFDYMTPDKVTMLATMLGYPKKYLPWGEKLPFEPGDVVFKDWRAKAAERQSLFNKMANQLGTYSPGASAAANLSFLAGQQAEGLSKDIDEVDAYNVQVANAFADRERQRKDINNAANLAKAEELYKGNVIANQQYDNAKRVYYNNMAKAFGNAWKNRMYLGLLNSVNPMFNIDPWQGQSHFKGGYGSEDLGGALFGTTTGTASTGSTYKDRVSDYLRRGYTIDDARKYAAEDDRKMSSTGSLTNKQAALQATRALLSGYGALGAGFNPDETTLYP